MKTKVGVRPDIIYLPFLLSLVFWSYLLVTTQMSIVYDGIAFFDGGQLIHEKGLTGYFSAGLQREFLYPYVVSLAIGLSGLFHVSFEYILKFFHILFLLSTQILVFIALRELHVKKWITFLALMLVGFSPSLVSSAMSIWSEILTLPLTVLLVLLSSRAWRNLHRDRHHSVIVDSIGLSLVMIVLISVKALYAYIFWLYCLPFIILIFVALYRKNRIQLKKSLIFCACMVICVQSYVFMYKSVNKHFNGNFIITKRGSRVLAGNAMKRVEPFEWKKIATNVAASIGDHACERLFDKEACYFWNFQKSAEYGYRSMKECSKKGLEGSAKRSCVTGQAITAIKKKPFLYVLFTTLEGVKMFFWETTQLSFVVYPGWLNQIYKFRLFRDGIRLLMALLTLAGFLMSVFYVCKHREKIFDARDESAQTPRLLFFSLVLIISHMAFYCLSTILVRYVTPIVPVLILTIAHAMDRLTGPADRPTSFDD